MKRKRMFSKITAIFIMIAMLLQLMPTLVFAGSTVNVAEGKFVTGDGYDLDYLVDGNEGTSWYGTGSGDTVIIDLGDVYTITQAVIKYSFIMDLTLSDADFESSIDGTEYTLLEHISGNYTLENILDYSGNPKTGRYFRLENIQGMPIPGIKEIELYGELADVVDGEDTDAEGNEYFFDDNGDGTATITSFIRNGDTSVVIPDTLDGLNVTAINNGGVFMSKGLTSVSIPSTVTTIGDNAFRNNSLTSLTIPDNVTSIANDAFGYNSISTVVFGSNLTTIGNGIFANNQLTSITIPARFTSIGGYAFQNNLLTEVTIENAAATIHFTAFFGNQTDDPSALTIHGYTGSTAEGYADDNGHTFIALDGGGDDDIPDGFEVVNGNYYEYDDNGDGTATIIYFEMDASSDIEIPSTVDGLTVIAIGNGAFEDCGITTVVIPDTVTSIGNYAFADNGLTSVTIGNGVISIGYGAFAYNELESVEIPGSVTSIDEEAFNYNLLESVFLGEHVESIGDYAFAANRLTSVTIENSTVALGDDVFTENQDDDPTALTIYGYTGSTAENYADIYGYAFVPLDGGDGDVPTVLPSNGQFTDTDDDEGEISGTITWTGANPDTDITGYKIFWGQNESTKLTGHEAVIYTVIGASETSQEVEVDTSLPAGAFYFLIYSYNGSGDSMNCMAVPINDKQIFTDANGNVYAFEVNVDDAVTIIGFTSGGSTEVIIPDSLNGKEIKHIGKKAFWAKGLTGVTIPGSVTIIGEEAFSWNNLTSVSIPDSVISIEKKAFEYNYNTLTSVVFGSGLKSIGDSAFFNCKLDSIIIPDNVETIGEQAFTGATNDIKSITLGSGLLSIGNYAFSEHECQHISIPPNVTTIGLQAFSSIKYQGADLIIYGSEGSVAHTYASTNSHTFIAPTRAPEGDGTEESPYLIQTKVDLLWVAQYNKVNTGFEGLHFEQTDDIDMSSVDNFLPIGDASDPFEGKYNGGGYKIAGFKVDASNKSTVGLFGEIGESGEVKSVILEDISIKSVNDDNVYVGGIAGRNYGTILDCHIKVSDGGQSLISGIADAAVFCGGIAGENANTGTVSRCSNEAAVEAGTGTGGEFYYVGGIAGLNKGAISDCHNSGSISNKDGNVSEGIFLGGISGMCMPTGSISFCFNTGEINLTGEDDHYISGGIAAAVIDATKISSSLYLDTTAEVAYMYMNGPGSFDTSTTGVATQVELRAPNTFDGWNTDIWSFSQGNLPFLKSLTQAPAPNPAYAVTYSGNGSTGGTVPTDNGSYTQGALVTVLGNTGNLVRTGYTFAGWNKAANGSGTNYTAGASFTMENDNVILYAKWTAAGGGNNSGGGNSSASAPVNNNTNISVNGETQGNAATTKTEESTNGQTTTTVTLDEKKIGEILNTLPVVNTNNGNTAQNPPVITIPVTGKADKVVGELDGQMVKNMENKNVVLEIKTETAAYSLPAQQIDISAVSQSIGQDVKLSDIKVQIEIAKPTEAVVKVVEDSANKGNFTLVVPPVEFKVSCTYENKTVEVSQFNNYVERTVAIPDGVDPGKITTGVVIDPDGTVRHVPTKIIVIDGKYYAQINSLTNSTYSVVWHPIEFKDVSNHWAKEAIIDMGSRMVISGDGNGNFAPDRDITRAEFAAILVRTLGLKPGTGMIPFTDVKGTDWHSSYVITAAEYKIISGYGDGIFGPNDKITREQAMTMISRAMNITGLKVEFESGEVEKLLAGFGDADKSESYAKVSIASCIKTGIISGRDGSLVAPKENITRVEVAVIVRRLLQKSNLI